MLNVGNHITYKGYGNTLLLILILDEEKKNLNH